MAFRRRSSDNRGPIKYSMFFDRDVVRSALSRAEEKYLARVGFRIRDSAKRSIRPKGKARFASVAAATARARASGSRMRRLLSAKARKRYQSRIKRAASAWQRQVTGTPASSPGKPPFTHTGFLPAEIVYAFDPSRHSVVVGTSRSPWLGKLHEHGGTRPQWAIHDRRRTHKVLGHTTRRPSAGFIARLAKRGLAVSSTRPARYPPRPFMAPAAAKQTPKLPRLWADSVKQSMREQPAASA